jgi:sugar transferase EpsL
MTLAARRPMDILGACAALLAVGPVALILAAVIRAKIGSLVLFRQTRLGLHGEPFTLLKFRTMAGARDANGNLLPDAHRLTTLGRLLRRTSLGELPERWTAPTSSCCRRGRKACRGR